MSYTCLAWGCHPPRCLWVQFETFKDAFPISFAVSQRTANCSTSIEPSELNRIDITCILEERSPTQIRTPAPSNQ